MRYNLARTITKILAKQAYEKGKKDKVMGKNRLFIIVDVQNDFVSGSLGSEAAQNVIPLMCEYLKDICEDESTRKIIFTQDTHFNDKSEDARLEGNMPYDETLEGEMLPVEHCIKGTWGWEIVPEVKEAVSGFKNVSYCQKRTFMCEKLINHLVQLHENSDTDSSNSFDEIVIFGFCTSICVLSNALALRGYFPDMKITLIENLCADIDEESHYSAEICARNCQINVARIF
jgi:nicotinamidase-related amidase